MAVCTPVKPRPGLYDDRTQYEKDYDSAMYDLNESFPNVSKMETVNKISKKTWKKIGEWVGINSD